LLHSVHEFVPEKRVGRLTSQPVGDVNVGAERDCGRAMVVGHPIACMDANSGEIRVKLQSEMARFIGFERLYALSRLDLCNQLLHAPVPQRTLQLQNLFVRRRRLGQVVDDLSRLRCVP
jgi:hypothetical protein